VKYLLQPLQSQNATNNVGTMGELLLVTEKLFHKI